MARVCFIVGTRYLLNGQVYRIKQILVEGRLLIENQSFGGQLVSSQEDLTTAWSQGELCFEVPTFLAKPVTDKPLATEYTHADFEAIPATHREEAWRRYQILLPLLQLPSHLRTRAAIQAYAATLQSQNADASGKRGPLGTAIGWASIERWLRTFEESGYDIRALVPAFDRSARKGEQRLDPELETIVQGVLNECDKQRMKRTTNDVYLMVVNRVAEANRSRPSEAHLNLPASKTIYRRIQSYGPTILRRRNSRLEDQADASIEEGPKLTRILEVVEMDHTLLDFFVVDEEDRLSIGRPRLTFGLEGYAGFPYGIDVGFEPPSYQTVANALLHGILPKPDVQTIYGTKNPWPVYGLPEKLNVDNGKEFIGGDLRDACGQLGIILEYMPIRTPWFKGSIERFFKSNNTGLIHGLPGTTFSNIIDKGDYDAMKYACISLSAFWQLLHIFLLDIYAQQWHSGKKTIPFKRWQESMQSGFIPSLHTSAEETRILLMRSDERTIQRQGIEFEYLYYRSPDLGRLRSLLPKDNRIVRIKHDPGDISSLYVSDPINKRWLRVPAADQSYTQGLSLWKHRIINRLVLSEKGEVDIEALAEAKERIRRIVANEYTLTRSNQGRKTTARLLGIGVPSAASSDPPQLPSDTNLETSPINTSSIEPLPDSVPHSILPSQKPKTKITPVEPSSQVPIPPSRNDDLDGLNLAGWGSDYNLP